MENNRRQYNRISVNCPIDLKIDSQITIKGTLKNISPKSAFIEIKISIAMQINDQFDFHFKSTVDNDETGVSGTICISRIIPGQGIAVYFIQMDDVSSERLKQLMG